MLDHLFSLLFHKRSEAVALQFLLENLPYVFEADRHSQNIAHETFKYYMLKQPERFSLLIQAFADELVTKSPEFEESRKTFLQYLAAMLRVASDVNHKQLAREFLSAIMKFAGHPYCNEVLTHIAGDEEVRKPFRDMLTQLRGGKTGSYIEAAHHFRSSKRGRKPSFARAEGLGNLHQVHYPGGIDVQKLAS